MSDGRLNQCKECKKGYSAKHYRDIGGTSDYDRKREQGAERRAQKKLATQKHRANNPLKYKARTAVSNALRSGRLLKGSCEVCGSAQVQAHHHDYAKPLDVRWLCFVHHREHEHGQTIDRQPRPSPSQE